MRDLCLLTLSAIGSGGTGDAGQRIRDEILHIQSKNNAKGGMMEQWHQKLHNNTSPDDVFICEALLAYLRADMVRHLATGLFARMYIKTEIDLNTHFVLLISTHSSTHDVYPLFPYPLCTALCVCYVCANKQNVSISMYTFLEGAQCANSAALFTLLTGHIRLLGHVARSWHRQAAARKL